MYHADMFNTTNINTFIPQMKIQSNNGVFNHDINAYPEGLQIPIQYLNAFVLHHELASSFSISMEWLSSACSTTVYNKTGEVITFQIKKKRNKNLKKKEFS